MRVRNHEPGPGTYLKPIWITKSWVHRKKFWVGFIWCWKESEFRSWLLWGVWTSVLCSRGKESIKFGCSWAEGSGWAEVWSGLAHFIGAEFSGIQPYTIGQVQQVRFHPADPKGTFDNTREKEKQRIYPWSTFGNDAKDLNSKGQLPPFMA